MEKILFLTNIPSPYRVAFFSELGKEYDLTVCFEGHTATDRDIKWKNDTYAHFRTVFLRGIRTGTDNFLCPGVLKYINKKWDYIVVAGYSTPTQMLAIEKLRLLRIPFYLEADGGFVRNESKYKYLIKKHFISSACSWLTSGRITNEYFKHYGADINKCYVYPFTSISNRDIQTAKEKIQKTKKYYKAEIGASEEFIVLTVGRFTYDNGYGKGYDLLLKTAEVLNKKIGIYIVGGEPTEEFRNWKNEKKLTNVHFVGFKTKKELEEYYLAADVFVLMTRGDVWGLVINEAMMYGLPVVTSDKCGAAYELVRENKNGHIISIEEPQKLEEYLAEYYYNPDKCMSHGRESLNIIQGYTIEKMVETHVRIFELENHT